MRYKPLSKELFIGNRNRLINQLPDNAMAIIYANDQMPRNGDQYHPYRQNSDLFFLSGIDQEKSVLILFPGCPNPKYREVLFLIETNSQIALWEGHKYTKNEADNLSGIPTIFWLDQLEVVLREMMSYAQVVYLNQNEYFKFTPEVDSRQDRYAALLREKFPLHRYERLAPLLIELRLIKQPAEIDAIQTAISITRDAFLRVLKFVEPGVREYEVEAEITHEFIRKGCFGHAYAPIVASGPHATCLHYVDNDGVCNDGDMILFDFGAEYANYAADLSRTIPVNGRFTPRQRACYQSVLNVLNKAMPLMVVGSAIDEFNHKVNVLWQHEHIALGLYSKADLDAQEDEFALCKKFYPHGTSHFMGLDVHDVGSRTAKFEPGMVLTCEPGIYIQEEGIGIRLENDVLITDGGPVNLMADIPIDPDEIEKLMR